MSQEFHRSEKNNENDKNFQHAQLVREKISSLKPASFVPVRLSSRMKKKKIKIPEFYFLLHISFLMNYK